MPCLAVRLFDAAYNQARRVGYFAAFEDAVISAGVGSGGVAFATGVSFLSRFLAAASTG